MLKKLDKIMDIMNSIEYGFKDETGFNIINDSVMWDNEFYKFYYLLSPDELLEKKCGVCWDQVELERYLFNKNDISCDSYWICIYDGNNLPSHTFLTFNDGNNYYWFEHSWEKYRGIHKYDSLNYLLCDVKEKFILSHSEVSNFDFTFVYKYDIPKAHISCSEFYDYIETQQLVKLNKPLYFYHLIDKNCDMSTGILSLQYMYDNFMYDLFDKSVHKYIDRITGGWNIEKYRNKSSLSRKEIMDALRIFRGNYGCSYIYFFRYAPYSELGNRMKELLKYKDIYRININDEEVLKSINDIFYGYDMSNSDNSVLDKSYYENVSVTEYFSKYVDSLKINFSTLNHIGIAFKENYCPIKFLEKI